MPPQWKGRRASEQEQIDPFYCISFLDKAALSGVDRPVTLRDKDIEISFPYKADEQAIDGWLPLFPPLINLHSTYSNTTGASQPAPKPHGVYYEPIPPIQHNASVPSLT
jgi:hypothetical protein